MWLFALERSFCSNVVVLGFATAGLYHAHLEATLKHSGLVNRAMAHLGLGWVTYSVSLAPPVDSILLVSGSVPFLREVTARPTRPPTLLLGTAHLRGRRVPAGLLLGSTCAIVCLVDLPNLLHWWGIWAWHVSRWNSIASSYFRIRSAAVF